MTLRIPFYLTVGLLSLSTSAFALGILNALSADSTLRHMLTCTDSSDLKTMRHSGTGSVMRNLLLVAGRLGIIMDKRPFCIWLGPIKERLARAGYPLQIDAYEFVGMCILLSGLLAAISLFGTGAYEGAVVGGIAGFVYPSFWLVEREASRRQCMAKDVPFVVDLLAISVDAGLGLNSALLQVVAKGKGGPLIDELHKTLYEIRMGRPRNVALSAMAKRVGVEDINSLVEIIVVTDRFGTSVATILKGLAKQMRVRRLQRAEASALKAPVKMVFPLVFFIFPTILVVLLGPVLLENFFALS